MTLKNIALFVGTIAIVTGMAAYVAIPWLGEQFRTTDTRPANVPDDFVPILQIGKRWLWAKCWIEGPDTRCRIFDEGGELLHDDLFITYARGLSVAAVDLAIVPERSGRDYLWLKNGEILLPKTNYREHRQNVEKTVDFLRK